MLKENLSHIYAEQQPKTAEESERRKRKHYNESYLGFGCLNVAF